MAFFGRIQRAVAEARAGSKERAEQRFLKNVNKLDSLEQEKIQRDKRLVVKERTRELKQERRAERTAGVRRVVKGFGRGLGKIKEVQSKARLKSNLRQGGGFGQQRDIFGGTRNVFSPEVKTESRPKPKNVIINVK